MLHSFEATSMRVLTSSARVNLAAVNYHFGSKDALIEAVFRRKLDPMNAARIEALERLEAASAPQVPTPEAIIRAFIGPSLKMIEDAKGGGRIRLERTRTVPVSFLEGREGRHSVFVRI